MTNDDTGAKFPCEQEMPRDVERPRCISDSIRDAKGLAFMGTDDGRFDVRCIHCEPAPAPPLTDAENAHLGGNIMRALREDHDLVGDGQGRSGEEVRECGGAIALVFLAAFFTTMGFVLRGLL